MLDIRDIAIAPTGTLRDAIEAIGRGAAGIALVVDGDQHLLNVITDGDVRRAILAGGGLHMPLTELQSQRQLLSNRQPITAHCTTPVSALRSLMQERSLRHIPLLNDSGQVVDLAYRDSLTEANPAPVAALIMAKMPSAHTSGMVAPMECRSATCLKSGRLVRQGRCASWRISLDRSSSLTATF